MITLSLILWTLVAFGIAQIVVESSLLEPVRLLLAPVPFVGVLVNCMLCTGTWAGFVLSLTLWSPTAAVFPDPTLEVPFAHVFFDGMLSGCLVWYLHVFEQDLTRN
jgi:hypothetical protein